MATVTNQTQLRSAVQSGTDPEILVANNITVTSYIFVNRSVTIRTDPSNPTATLFWSPPSATTNQYMFLVYANGNLMMDTLTMDGQGRNCGMVRLSGGTFTMNEGTTITGIYSRTSNSAVLVGDMMSTVGGTFIMNGGLITGVDAGPHTTVFCAGGTVEMSGEAAIENNPSAGITTMHNLVDNTRSNVRITGNARIANNQSGQSGAGMMLLYTDAVIGENENDAPIISGNYTPYSAGGIVALEAVNLTIGGKTEISGNSALETSGAILVQGGSTLRMNGSAKVKDNKSGGISGGISVTSNTAAVLEDDVEISGNTAGDETVTGGAGIGDAGGILMQTGASLEIKGNVSINGNTANNGGGIYLATPSSTSTYSPPTAVIGTEDSSPSVHGNTAAGLGGGIFIADRCTATLTGQSSFYDNKAVEGKGVYNGGICRVGKSLRILDGLFFDNADAEGYSDFSPEQTISKVRIESSDSGVEAIEYKIELHTTVSSGVQETGKSPSINADGSPPAQCDRAPIIDEALTAEAEIHVEASKHVTPPNVSLVIANGDADTIPLLENDRAAWRIPSEFTPGYVVRLTSTLEQVIIDVERYSIEYKDLLGAANPNPDAYDIKELPIRFAVPGERKGYVFTGWRSAAGSMVSEISEGTTGNLSFTAVWQTQEYSIVYNDLFGARHSNPVSYNVENLPILLTAPDERPEYVFLGWHDAAGMFVTEIPEGTTGNLSFTAVWQAQDYNIVYNNLFGVRHSNPVSYNVESLPILLAVPDERPGYVFLGWRDAAGMFVTEIPEGTTGNLSFTAVWSGLSLSFDGNAPCVCNVPETIRAERGVVDIPRTIPCRPCYIFVCWNESASGSGKSYCPGDKIYVSGRNVKLYAQWQYIVCC